MLWIGLVLCVVGVFMLWAMVVLGKDADKQMEKIISRK